MLINSISLGKYIPGNSVIHKLDPRTKLCISAIISFLLFFSQNLYSLILIFVAVVNTVFIAKIPLIKFIKSNIFIISVSVFTTLINLFFEAQSKFISSGIFYISSKNITDSSIVCLRLFSVILISSVFMLTTSPSEIAYSAEKMLKPFGFLGINPRDTAFTITVTLRFIPTVFEESGKIINAQKSRGACFKNKNIFKTIKAFSSVIIPLFVSSFKRADDLAVALESRAYSGTKPHTHLKTFRLGLADVWAFACTAILTMGVIILCVIKTAG